MGEHSDSRAGCQCGTMVKFTNRSPNPQLFVRCALLVTEYISQIRSTSKGGAYARNSGMHRASLCPPRPPQVAMLICGGGIPIYWVYSREMEVTRNSWPSTLRLGGYGGGLRFQTLVSSRPSYVHLRNLFRQPSCLGPHRCCGPRKWSRHSL